MIRIEDLKFDERGLIPAIVQDAKSGDVLMLAYMNKESLEISMEKGLTCFYSRSRDELWLKGETSGNYQHILDITADCDLDALRIYVRKDGPACHTGAESCFYNELWINKTEASDRAESGDASDGESEDKFTMLDLMKLIEGRKTDPKEGSYTTYLFEKGLDKILKKVGEESTEVIIAAMNDMALREKSSEDSRAKAETIYEISDLVYHVMVLMIEMGISLDDIKDELASRHVVDHKIKQEKMTSK